MPDDQCPPRKAHGEDSWSAEEDGDALLFADLRACIGPGYRPRVDWARHPSQRDSLPPQRP